MWKKVCISCKKFLSFSMTYISVRYKRRNLAEQKLPWRDPGTFSSHKVKMMLEWYACPNTVGHFRQCFKDVQSLGGGQGEKGSESVLACHTMPFCWWENGGPASVRMQPTARAHDWAGGRQAGTGPPPTTSAASLHSWMAALAIHCYQEHCSDLTPQILLWMAWPFKFFFLIEV